VKHTPALPAAPASPPLLRDAVLEDVPALRALDHAAFTPPWQMHTDELRQAVRYAASVTLALQEERLVGYQISTRHHTSAHLARLAVAPAQQGQGIGAALLHDLLTRFGRRGVRTMTVNTQQHNVQSLRLYARYEFQRNGFDLPVWQRALP
jgi:ribosomal-protein-alanine N-acetyltransferase